MNPQLWMCLGSFGGERGLRALREELERGTPQARAAAALALGRLDEKTRENAGLDALLAPEKNPLVQNALRRAKLGRVSQTDFQPFDGPVPKVV